MSTIKTSPLSVQSQQAMRQKAENLSIAVLLPCKNEATTIAKVVKDFYTALPSASIYVYDNNSTDDTAEIAAQSGARVGYEIRPGKGNVIRRMFVDIEADLYIMVDGDDTYDASQAPLLVKKLINTKSDMVIGTRLDISNKHQRTGHGIGNKMFNLIYRFLFGREFTDIFSGYRIFSRRFVKSFPALSSGFEIETELSVHASQLRLPVAEIAFEYKNRPEGSESKLSTIRDGLCILKTIIILLKEYKPLYFFGSIGLLGMILSILVAIPVLWQFTHTGKIEGIASAVLSTGIMIISMLTMTAGVILDSIRRFRVEVKHLFYNHCSSMENTRYSPKAKIPESWENLQ